MDQKVQVNDFPRSFMEQVLWSITIMDWRIDDNAVSASKQQHAIWRNSSEHHNS